MSGKKALRKIQLGREAVAGTPVAATTIWRGMGTIEDTRETVYPEEAVGYLSGLDRAYVPTLGGKLAMPSGEATFQELNHVFEAGIKAATGVADGGGTNFIYAYPLPTTTINVIKTYTIEGGDDQAVEEMEYCFVEAFKLSGRFGQALMCSADWMGRQVVTSSFTGALSIPTVEEIIFSKATLAIDAVGDTLGDTIISNTLYDMDLDVKTGIVAQGTANGQLYFSHLEFAEPEVVLQLTFLHNAAGAAEVANWRAGTPQQIQILIVGSEFGTAGDDYTYHTLQIDLAGRWEKFDPIGEQDGIDIVKGTFRARYEPTAALFAVLTLANELSAVP